ncbi:unnamed protein product [Gongylonema pulchrum]|uniref:Uncharacterized protein n=1 Tax=Gongylonema pulchrum TaxID=637853 RepID=A0A183EQF7_9BILA|nr:unnamed protein product [Gongylonema pulchrum]
MRALAGRRGQSSGEGGAPAQRRQPTSPDLISCRIWGVAVVKYHLHVPHPKRKIKMVMSEGIATVAPAVLVTEEEEEEEQRIRCSEMLRSWEQGTGVTL